MHKKLTSFLKPLAKTLVLLGLVLALALGSADGALAATGGGRIGGGSFRMPSRTYTAPSRTYTAPRGGGYYPGGGYPGGGFGFPFFMPPFFFVGGGFGGLFSILIFLAIAGFLVQTFQRLRSGGEELDYTSDPTISVAKVQVGLLAGARSLQTELNQIARRADTGSSAGLAQVLQETSLALLRHPEYWVYGGGEAQQARLQAAEVQFNRLALAERSKFSGETLSNVNSQLRQAGSSSLTVADKAGDLASQGPGEYIVVTLLAGFQGKLQLPQINSSNDLRQALSQLGAVGSDRLLALEVLWTPQAEGDVLTSEDLLVEYPSLKLL